MGPKTDDLDRIDTEEELDENSSVEETRAQIERTRGEMSGTIDAIKEKLNPQTLAEKAKETVSEVTSDVMEQAKAAVHSVVQEAKETLPDLTADVAHQAVGSAVNTAKEAVGSAVNTAKEAVGDAVSTVRRTATDAGSSVVDVIRANPIPYALIGLGLGWLWASRRSAHDRTVRHETSYYPTGYPSYYDEGDWGRGTVDTTRSASGYESLARSGPYPGSISREDPSKMGEVAGQVQEKVGHLASQVQEKVGQVQEKAGQVAGQLQERVGHVAHRAQETVTDLGSRAGQQARNVASGCQRMMEENPLALGAVALGLGAAIGMMLPRTYREDRLMGEARDHLIERAQHTAEDLAGRAQIVAEEALDTAKQEAQNQGLSP